MRVICACDPWGSSLHRRLVEHLRGKGAGVDVDDRGLFGKYYEAAHAVGGEVEAAAAAGGGDTRGLLVCGPGQVRGRRAVPWLGAQGGAAAQAVCVLQRRHPLCAA
jgi:hypothetical protein